MICDVRNTLTEPVGSSKLPVQFNISSKKYELNRNAPVFISTNMNLSTNNSIDIFHKNFNNFINSNFMKNRNTTDFIKFMKNKI